MRRLEWYIARRYLASRRKGRFLSLITLIAVGGVFLGVTALITVIGVMTGLQQDLQQKILGSNPHIYFFDTGAGLRLGDWRRTLQRITMMDDVVAAEPFIMTSVMITLPDVSFARPGTLFGIDPFLAKEPLSEVERQIRDGELALGPTQSGLPGILLGSDLQRTMTALPGDTIVVFAAERFEMDPSTGYPRPQVRRFEVVGSFDTGMYEYDNSNMYTTLEAAQDLLALPSDTVTGLAVNVKSPWDADVAARAISDALGPRHYHQTWMDLNGALFSALKLEKLAMAVILFMIVLVAAFNIVSTLIMVVTDKTREIGILKSMGLTHRAVLRIFILQGITIGVIGTALGALGGLGIVYVLDRYGLIKLPGDVYFVETLPVALEPLDFALIVVVSVLIAFIATIYPARQAARLLPVEAIRHE